MRRDALIHVKTAQRLLVKAEKNPSVKDDLDDVERAIQSLGFARDKLKKSLRNEKEALTIESC